MNKAHVIEIVCPSCGVKTDRAMQLTHHNDKGPKKGDLACCAYCGALNVFEDNGVLKIADADTTINVLKEYPQMKKMMEDPPLAHVLQMKRRGSKP